MERSKLNSTHNNNILKILMPILTTKIITSLLKIAINITNNMSMMTILLISMKAVLIRQTHKKKSHTGIIRKNN